MSLVSQLHSSRQLNLPVMQWVVVLCGEFRSFPQPKLCPAAQCCVQSVVMPSLAVHKIGKYHRKIPKILFKPRAGRIIFVGLFAGYNQVISESFFLFLFLSMPLFWFTCRMFLFTKKTETIQKETGIFVHPAAAFLCCLFFFLSFHLEKEKAEREKSILILYSSVLLPFPPYSFLPIPSLPKVHRIPQFLGVFFTEHRHREQFYLSAGA